MPIDSAFLYGIGIALLIAGIIIIIAVVILASLRSDKKGKVQAAGVIMIGPIPIIFGTDKKAVKEVLALVIVLMAIALTWIIVNYLLQG